MNLRGLVGRRLGSARSLTTLTASLASEVGVEGETASTRDLPTLASDLLVKHQTITLLVRSSGFLAANFGTCHNFVNSKLPYFYFAESACVNL